MSKNQSFISYNIFGQTKSAITCPTCSYRSTRYDPFLTYSLSIPNFNQKKVKILYVFFEPNKTSIIQTFILNSNSKISKLKSMIKTHFNCPSIILGAYSNNILKGFIKEDADISDIGHNDVIAFEAPEYMENIETIPLIVSQDTKTSKKSILTYTRVLFLDSSYTLIDIHILIAYYFKDIIEKLINSRFHDGYEGLNQLNKLEHKLYKLKIVNQSKEIGKLPCDYCGNIDCKNCELPQTDEFTLKDLLSHRKHSTGHFALEIN